MLMVRRDLQKWLYKKQIQDEKIFEQEIEVWEGRNEGEATSHLGLATFYKLLTYNLGWWFILALHVAKSLEGKEFKWHYPCITCGKRFAGEKICYCWPPSGGFVLVEFTFFDLSSKLWRCKHFDSISVLLLRSLWGGHSAMASFSKIQSLHLWEPLEKDCALDLIDQVILYGLFCFFNLQMYLESAVAHPEFSFLNAILCW